MADKTVSILVQFRQVGAEAVARSMEMLGGAAKSLASEQTSGFSAIASAARTGMGVVGSVLRGLASPFTFVIDRFRGMVGAFTRGFDDLTVSTHRWASLFVGIMLTKVAAAMVGTVATVEQTRIAFETLLKSGEAAGDLMKWITEMSIRTPIARVQVQKIAQEFLAYGHNLEETKKATMAVIEATSALGIDETRLGAITYNLGQIYRSTTVSFREVRDLQKQAVPVMELLTKAVNEGQLSMSGYARGAAVAGGASKKLAESYEKVTSGLPDLQSSLDIQKKRLEDLTSATGTSATQVSKWERELKQAEQQMSENNKVIQEYRSRTVHGAEATKDIQRAYDRAVRSNQTLTDRIGDYRNSIRLATDDAGSHARAVDNTRLQISKLEKQIADGTKTINEYATAEAGRGKVIAQSTEGLKELSREQIEQILAMNTGKEIALALEDQMIKTYGGAALRQVKSLTGIISNFGDIFQYVMQRAMGVSLEGEVAIGGAFDRIRTAAAELAEFLIDNIDRISEVFNRILSDVRVLAGAAGFLIGAFRPFILGILQPILSGPALAFGLLAAGVMELVNQMGGLNKVSERVRDALTSITESDVWKTFENAANDTIPRLKSVVDGAKSSFVEITDTITGDVREAFDVLGSVMGEVAGSEFFVALKTFVGETLVALKDVLVDVGNGLQGINDRLGEIRESVATPMLETLKQDFKDGMDSLKESMAGVTGVIRPIEPTWTQAFKTFGDTINETIGNTANSVLKDFKDAMVFAQPEIDELKDALKELYEALKPLIPVIIKIITFFILLAAAITTGLVQALMWAIPGLIGFVTGVVRIITGLVKIVVGLFNLNWTMVREGLGDFVGGFLKMLDGLVVTVFGLMAGFVKGIFNFFKGLWDALVGGSLIPEMVEALIDWFVYLKDRVFHTIRSLVVSIINAFNNFLTTASDFGKSLISAIISGILNMAGPLRGQLEKLLGGIQSWAKVNIPVIVEAVPSAPPQPPGRKTGQQVWSELMKLFPTESRMDGRGEIWKDWDRIFGGHPPESLLPPSDPNILWKHPEKVPQLTVNFSGEFVMDTDDRVNQLAERVAKILGRQSELAALGAAV